MSTREASSHELASIPRITASSSPSAVGVSGKALQDNHFGVGLERESSSDTLFRNSIVRDVFQTAAVREYEDLKATTQSLLERIQDETNAREKAITELTNFVVSESQGLRDTIMIQSNLRMDSENKQNALIRALIQDESAQRGVAEKRVDSLLLSVQHQIQSHIRGEMKHRAELTVMKRDLACVMSRSESVQQGFQRIEKCFEDLHSLIMHGLDHDGQPHEAEHVQQLPSMHKVESSTPAQEGQRTHDHQDAEIEQLRTTLERDMRCRFDKVSNEMASLLRTSLEAHEDWIKKTFVTQSSFLIGEIQAIRAAMDAERQDWPHGLGSEPQGDECLEASVPDFGKQELMSVLSMAWQRFSEEPSLQTLHEGVDAV